MPNIDNLNRHGGNIYAASRKLGLEGIKVLDFSASINPLGMPPSARNAIKMWVGDVLHYPDTESSRLKNAIADRFELRHDQIIAGNGSTELIYLIPRALRPRRVVIATPAFTEYERACRLAGTEEIEHFPLQASNNFLPHMENFIATMKNADMAFFCNPGNPSGAALSRDRVLELAEAAKSNDCIFVVDEAFADFCPEHSVLGQEIDNMIVLRSLTKFYALAGLRVGFSYQNSAITQKIMHYKEPWSVNALVERAAAASLADTGFPLRSRSYARRERERLAENLSSLGFKVFPSEANYLLIESPYAHVIAVSLEAQGILVRRCLDFKGLGERFLRIAVRTKKENLTLVDAIKTITSNEAQAIAEAQAMARAQ